VAKAFSRRALAVTLSYRLPFAAELLTAVLVVAEFFFIGKIVPSSEVGGGYFAFVTVGLVVSAFLAAGVATIATTIRDEQSQGTLELVLASGLSAGQLAVGVATFPLIEACARSALYLGAALLLGLRLQGANIGVGFLGLAVGSSAFVGLGLVGVSLVLVFRRASAAVAWIVGIASFASGVLFPPRVLPEWLQQLARLSPVTVTLEVVRGGLLDGASLVSMLDELALLVMMSLACLGIGVASIHAGLRWARRSGTLAQY
jgi:ABC-2 type transport system permease protein